MLKKLIICVSILLCLFGVMFGIRVYLTTTFLQAYQQNMNLDSSVSDMMQLAEFLY